MLQLLLAHGADYSLCDGDGCSALQRLAQCDGVVEDDSDWDSDYEDSDSEEESVSSRAEVVSDSEDSPSPLAPFLDAVVMAIAAKTV